MKKSKLILFTCVLACESPMSSESSGNVQTLRGTYVMESTSISRRIAVDLRFTNPLPETLHLGHCGGMPSILQKWEGSSWKNVVGTVDDDCGGTTAIVNAGDTYQRTIVFDGGRRGSNLRPLFVVDDVRGQYRVLLMEVLADHSGIGTGTLVHEKYRTSNVFQVTE